jgi:TonB family protein
MQAAFDEASPLVQQEEYRARVLNAYWWCQLWIAHHQDQIRALAGRVAADDAAARQARIGPPIERLTKELPAALVLRLRLDQNAALSTLNSISGLIFQLLNEERGKLAALASTADREHDSLAARVRTSPCPPASAHTSGSAVPKIEASSGKTEEFYPLETKNERFEGAVVVEALISNTGCMKKASVYESSGVLALDEAALRWAESALYDPAEKDQKPVEGLERFRVKFNMTR